ncbi:MAG: LamG domain-containing protein [Flavobacteriaceae bacterium]|nr:LamG domain-containing protein [Flavobacteriaceae bacterium]
MRLKNNILFLSLFVLISVELHTQTIAHWKFDEPKGLYPSHVLDDSSDNDYPLVIGKKGRIVAGKLGNALDMTSQYDLDVKLNGQFHFGLAKPDIPAGSTAVPLYWGNADFAAIMTAGEKHLRKQVGFVNPTDTKLNMGGFDWTVEFWYKPVKNTNEAGTVFEIGEGPIGEKTPVTSLSISGDKKAFILRNGQTAPPVLIPTKSRYLFGASPATWHHYAFVYRSGSNEITHYVDGKKESNVHVQMKALQHSENAYFSIGRNGFWKNPLPGILDELEFYNGRKYTKHFKLPKEADNGVKEQLKKGLPLLFAQSKSSTSPIQLGMRKHVFIDDAFLDKMDPGVSFTVNPPKQMERVISDIKGTFRKHLTVLEDQEGNIRIYNAVEDDYLAMRISKDGIHFEIPNLGKSYKGRSNIVIPEINGGMGNPFIDPNGPEEERYKYLSNYHKRGVYLYTSPDGIDWKRSKTAVLSFRSGSQTCTFYDDQTQEYVSYHRTDMLETPGKATLRGSVLVRMKDISKPVEYKQLTQEDYSRAGDTLRMRTPQPWFMDNGPLTPGGFGLEFPLKFLPKPEDPVGTDIYVTKAQKYPWAPDTYLAFPIVYFHYEGDGPKERITLMDPKRMLGEGPLETQFASSRDGIHWKRYPRPAYVGIGK